ncbi:helix-turn-helix domain-containing protein [Allopontixanthobacter sediminis]|uniref:AraC family transcriptional regulator n=1 Tax=Allopontixanthobacter sediminis TaxID=1689985 RepID=A0A845B5J5_9SPHN|nr:helix-turn-helix domain-containing protein [Allopontixanthobacter sediminis]MXP45426.1 AraC family transcriptional regulator [Allopontixanthobacter sediminis]
MLLSRTYRPSPSLSPYIRRYYVFEADLPDDMVIEDFLLAETAFVRSLLKGEWQGEIAPGEWSCPSKTLFFGANEVPFKVRVQGSFHVVGFAIRPSGWHGLFRKPHHEFVDQLLPLQDIWGDLAGKLQAAMESAETDEAKVAAMEAIIEERIAFLGTPATDPAIAKFETIARTDSTMRVDDAADDVGLSVRQFERRCRASFGLTPKAVLRRSRFLDMATAMRGFSSPTERDLAELRYFDQSHLNREFRRFTRMTPRQFERSASPLQTAGLKLREESRFED